MFLFAYRAFIDALGNNDRATIKKMTEPVLCARLLANIDNISKYNAK
jgi:predicted lipid-binding transport protein (Tim44 family)